MPCLWGFELPAQRTFFMLLLVTLSCQYLIRISAWQVLAWVALIMMWWDTTAVTQAGFWLSFVAVALLMNFSQNFSLMDSVQTPSKWWWIWHSIKQLFWLQLWLFVMMLPVVVWFFGKFSLISVMVNLLAVPFLGLLVVPLDMLAGVLSWLPVIGEGLSQKLWQWLSHLLILFHHFLQWLLDKGWAKSWYLAFNSQQMLVFVIIAIIWWLKGVLTRWLTLPLLLWVGLLAKSATTMENARLIVFDHQPISIHLLIVGTDRWLILADHLSPNQSSKAKPPVLVKDVLEMSIYPMLAKQNIDSLTGVISQTNSQPVNDLIQILAKNVPVSHYWLAGFHADRPNTWQFPSIQPKPCHVGQLWQQQGLTISALSGWQLNLTPQQINAKQHWQTQTCLLQIHAQFQQQKFSTLLLAGDGLLPMQMSAKMCLPQTVDLLVIPYQTPVDKHWLDLTKPTYVHLITGRLPSQKPNETTTWAISNTPTKIYNTTETGDVAYLFW